VHRKKAKRNELPTDDFESCIVDALKAKEVVEKDAHELFCASLILQLKRQKEVAY